MFKYLLVIFFMLSIISCDHSNRTVDSNSDTTGVQILSSSNSEKTVAQPNPNENKDTLSELMIRMKYVPLRKGWKVVGEPQMDIMTFGDVSFGDMIHYLFLNEKGDPFDFSANSTKFELEQSTDDENDDDGIIPNPKYIDKKFRIVWRRVKLTHKPKDELEMYYEDHLEILYLERL